MVVVVVVVTPVPVPLPRRRRHEKLGVNDTSKACVSPTPDTREWSVILFYVHNIVFIRPGVLVALRLGCWAHGFNYRSGRYQVVSVSVFSVSVFFLVFS